MEAITLDIIAEFAEINFNLDSAFRNKLKQVQQLVTEELNKDSKDKEQIKENMEHMNRVALIAMDLIHSEEEFRKSFTNEDIELIIIAACMHDIKKFKDSDKHDEEGEDFINNNSLIIELFKDNTDKIVRISKMIKFHQKGKCKKNGKLNKDNLSRKPEIKIIQDSDKISKIYKRKNLKDKETLLNCVDKKINIKGLNYEASNSYLENKLEEVIKEVK